MSALMKKYICWNEDLLWEITWYGLFRQTSINYIDECLIANNREVNAYFIVEKWVMPGDMEIPAPFNYKHFSENQTIFSSNTRDGYNSNYCAANLNNYAVFKQLCSCSLKNLKVW